jgi:NADH-quinone oxidoreductase subunit M
LAPEHSWWASLLWLPAFIAFAVKIPTFPFHHWLTLAHVEAPTCGSVVLAALLLKLGSYGFLRFMLPIFKNPDSFQFFMPVAATLCILSIIFAALMAISQSDLKRIVAYSSIAHMNFSLLGLMSMTDRAIVGGTIRFVAHGFVSAGMFFSVGFRYDRYHQRDLMYFRGLTTVAPVFSLFFFLFNLANLGVPLSFNFLGEFLIFAELINIYHFAAPRLVIALIVQVGYTMKLISILFGEVIYFPQSSALSWSDLSIHEIVIALRLVVPVWWFGVQGWSIIEYMTMIDPLMNRVDDGYAIYTEELFNHEGFWQYRMKPGQWLGFWWSI